MIDLYSKTQEGARFTFQTAMNMFGSLPSSARIWVSNKYRLDGKSSSRFGNNKLSPQEAIDLLSEQFWHPEIGHWMYRLAEYEKREVVVDGRTHLKHSIEVSIGEIVGACGEAMPTEGELVMPDLPRLRNTFTYIDDKPVRGRLMTFLAGLRKAG